MIGKEDLSGRRKKPFRHYMCSRKNREGWASCPSGKIRAEGPERAVLRFVAEQVLDRDFVTALVAELNDQLSECSPSVQDELDETRRRLDEVDRSIQILLDLAEQFGAASAGARLVAREAERKELQAGLRYLESLQKAQCLTVEPEVVQAMLGEMRDTLRGTDAKAKQALLKKVVVQVELGKERGKVAYTFALRDADLCAVPPGQCEQQDR